MITPEAYQLINNWARISLWVAAIFYAQLSSFNIKRQTSNAEKNRYKLFRNFLIGVIIVLVVEAVPWLTKNPDKKIEFWIGILGGLFGMILPILIEEFLEHERRKKHYSTVKVVLQLLGFVGMFGAVLLLVASSGINGLFFALLLSIISGRIIVLAANLLPNALGVLINTFRWRIKEEHLTKQLNRNIDSYPVIQNQTEYYWKKLDN